jgi:hypothetical protein
MDCSIMLFSQRIEAIRYAAQSQIFHGSIAWTNSKWGSKNVALLPIVYQTRYPQFWVQAVKVQPGEHSWPMKHKIGNTPGKCGCRPKLFRDTLCQAPIRGISETRQDCRLCCALSTVAGNVDNWSWKTTILMNGRVDPARLYRRRTWPESLMFRPASGKCIAVVRYLKCAVGNNKWELGARIAFNSKHRPDCSRWYQKTSHVLEVKYYKFTFPDFDMKTEMFFRHSVYPVLKIGL